MGTALWQHFPKAPALLKMLKYQFKCKSWRAREEYVAGKAGKATIELQKSLEGTFKDQLIQHPFHCQEHLSLDKVAQNLSNLISSTSNGGASNDFKGNKINTVSSEEGIILLKRFFAQ